MDSGLGGLDAFIELSSVEAALDATRIFLSTHFGDDCWYDRGIGGGEGTDDSLESLRSLIFECCSILLESVGGIVCLFAPSRKTFRGLLMLLQPSSRSGESFDESDSVVPADGGAMGLLSVSVPSSGVRSGVSCLLLERLLNHPFSRVTRMPEWPYASLDGMVLIMLLDVFLSPQIMLSSHFSSKAWERQRLCIPRKQQRFRGSVGS
mmetsp:Transcript_23530/g.49684  ORF Transcript_23530/g.49684 Transcript_23530/m.49684 type:complete len:207 (+) Transcript_23530:1868-2488(+)